MRAETARPYSYRDDPAVPTFPDEKPLFVFDGHCVLCSGGSSWLMKHARGRIHFASAQSHLGAALFQHYGIDPDRTYLLVAGGSAFAESQGYLELCRLLGGPWQVLRVVAVIPAGLRDWAYAVIARNRYRWFGKVEQCALLSEDEKAQLLG